MPPKGPSCFRRAGRSLGEVERILLASARLVLLELGLEEWYFRERFADCSRGRKGVCAFRVARNVQMRHPEVAGRSMIVI